MANRTKLTLEKRRMFLQALEEDGNVSKAAKLIDISRRYAYELRERDPSFAKEWDEAVDIALDNLEGEIYRRAVKGVESDVFYKGDSCGTKTEYSDTLAMFILKSRRPQVYGDKLKQEVTVKFPDPPKKIEDMTLDELREYKESLQKL